MDNPLICCLLFLILRSSIIDGSDDYDYIQTPFLPYKGEISSVDSYYVAKI